jgi:ornithine cyclodeaminase
MEYRMQFVTEAVSRTLVTRGLALDAAEQALRAAVDGAAVTFPAVLAHGARPDHRFSIKAASLAAGALTGLKIGTYWPSNADQGRPRHNSTVAFIDEATGRVGALVEAGAVNAYRTAAVDALAARCCARDDASVLAIFGAGHQAPYEVRAINDVRPLSKVLVVSRSRAAAQAVVDELQGDSLDADVCDAERACRSADIIVTVTASRAPLFKADWVRPGTHVASTCAAGAWPTLCGSAGAVRAARRVPASPRGRRPG